jgi:hypothetical protein
MMAHTGITWMLVLAAASTVLGVETEKVPFERYQVILERMPFGRPPPPPPIQTKPVDAPPPPPQSTFAKDFRVSLMIERPDGSVKVGLIDSRNKVDYMLEVGMPEEGIELVSADYEKQEAVIRKGSEMAVVKVETPGGNPGRAFTPSVQGAQHLQPKTRAAPPSYLQKRRERLRQAYEEQKKRRAAQPKMSGRELQQHLQDYQMEVIRKGLPPLPIPLTPEMDAKLVKEGVLPPVE